MRILIYGAGVTGSLYAVLLKEAGYYTTIYARGHRLEALQNQGFLYKKNNIIKKVDIKIIDHLQDNDIYDFIFLTVRENQLYQALKELKSNALFKKIVALGYLIQQKYRNDIRNMLP